MLQPCIQRKSINSSQSRDYMQLRVLHSNTFFCLHHGKLGPILSNRIPFPPLQIVFFHSKQQKATLLSFHRTAQFHFSWHPQWNFVLNVQLYLTCFCSPENLLFLCWGKFNTETRWYILFQSRVAQSIRDTNKIYDSLEAIGYKNKITSQTLFS